jgi:integrase
MGTSRANWGAVRELPSGRFQIRYRVDGARRTGDATYSTKREATAALAAIRTDLERGTWVDLEAGKSITLRTYATRWLDHRTNLAPRTHELYECELRVHILPAIGDLTLSELTIPRVRSWHAEMVKRSPGKTTPAKCYRLLRAILNTAVEDNLIIRNPCTIKGAGTERPAERPIATMDQVFALADAIEPRLRLMVLLATFASLRQGEIRGLTRRRIDLSKHEVLVVEQVQDLVDGSVVVLPPKSAASVRTVAIPPSLGAEVEHHLATFAGPDDDGLLFCTRDGVPIGKRNLHAAWVKARRAVGVEHLHFHDLRHTGNTMAAATGASTKELMERMGHSSARAALIYQHATRDRDREIAARLDDAISTTRGSSQRRTA